MPYSICSTGDHIMLLLFGRVSSSSWSMLWRPFHRTSWKVFPYDLRFSLAKAGLGLVVKGSLTNQGPVTLSLLKQNGQAKRIRPLMLLTKKTKPSKYRRRDQDVPSIKRLEKFLLVLLVLLLLLLLTISIDRGSDWLNIGPITIRDARKKQRWN